MEHAPENAELQEVSMKIAEVEKEVKGLQPGCQAWLDLRWKLTALREKDVLLLKAQGEAQLGASLMPLNVASMFSCVSDFAQP